MKKNRKESITSSLMWRFAERFLAQLVSFIVSLVLARILFPEDYGVVSLVLVFIEIANVFVTSGLGSALIQKKDADDLDFSSAFYFNILLSLVLYITLFFTAPFISSFFQQNLLLPILRVLGIRLLLAAVNSIQHAYVSRQMAFKKYFWATLFGTILSGIVGLVMAFNNCGAWALAAQYLVNTSVDTIILWFTVKWRPKLMYSWKRVGALFKFGWKLLAEGLGNIIASRIRNLVIGKAYTEADLGFYTKAQQFPSLFMNNISASISSVLFPAMSKVQDQEAELIRLLRRSIRISSYILFPMLFGLAAVGTNMVTVLLTDKWAECVPYLYIICFSTVLTVGMYPRHQALQAKGRSGVFMVEHILARIIDLVLLFFVYKISVFAIALSGVCGFLIMAFIVAFTSMRFNNYRFREQLKDVTGLFLMSTIMFVPTFLFGYFVDINPIVELIIQILLGVSIYLFVSVLFKPEGFIYVLTFIKRILPKNKESQTIDFERSKISFVVISILSILLSSFMRFLNLNLIWAFLIQILVFAVSFVLLSALTKQKFITCLGHLINATINKYNVSKGE